MRQEKINKVYLNIGMWSCLISALLEIVSCATSLLIKNSDGVITISSSNILTYFINTIFYLTIGNYFYRSKNDYKGRVLTAVLMLTISTYILPVIINLVFGVFSDGIQFIKTYLLLLCTMFIGSTCGIIYTIALILYSRDPYKKGRYNFLFVMGIILLVFGVIDFGLNLYFYIDLYFEYLSNVSLLDAKQIVYIISQLLLLVANLGFAFVYFYTPIFLKRR